MKIISDIAEIENMLFEAQCLRCVQQINVMEFVWDFSLYRHCHDRDLVTPPTVCTASVLMNVIVQ